MHCCEREFFSDQNNNKIHSLGGPVAELR